MQTEIARNTHDGDLLPSAKDQTFDSFRASDSSSEDGSVVICRVCHCSKSDMRGDTALGFLNILPPLQFQADAEEQIDSSNKKVDNILAIETVAHKQNPAKEPRFIEFISPEGEVFVCSDDLESGSFHHQDLLINLGCSCKNDLAFAHYACALKWFISHESTTCEICGSVCKNVKAGDIKKVLASLEEYKVLRKRTMTGELTHVPIVGHLDVDPDAIAAIRRQRLSEISMWFNPHNSSATVIPREVGEASFSVDAENFAPLPQNVDSRCTLEGSGFLIASGILPVVLSWFLAPHVGKKTAVAGLYILLAFECTITVMIFLRFLCSGSRFGPLRYWSMLFLSGFLVFGIWAQRTREARSSGS